jgi:hypothetical protein
MGAKIERFFGDLDIAIQLTVRQGVETAEAIEKGLRAMIAPLPRGKAGGLVRARCAWRYSDDTFMPESEKWESCINEYERYVAGGRARAARSLRAIDGTFLRG